MIEHRVVTTLVGLVALSCAVLFGCGGRTEGHATDTKTNWLASCEGNEECDDGLTCVCGVCTVDCTANTACEPFDAEAGCFHAECATGGGVCALPETPLEGRHMPESENCPRPADDYLLEISLCAGAAIDCQVGAIRFDDACGCGCEPSDVCDPSVNYMGYGTECESIDYDCATSEERIEDGCGCGCKPVPPPVECPRPADSYLATADECNSGVAELDCAIFIDECGCGCDTSIECDPAVEYVAYGERCQLVDFQCDDGMQQVTDECGCGCRLPMPEPVCPRADEAYTAKGETCDASAIECALGTTYFRDECGCGCEPTPGCDPNIDYVMLGGCFGAIFACSEGEMTVSDECGCGCTRLDVPAGCPLAGDLQPSACDVVCPPETAYVSGECGCGCARFTACDPDVNYVVYGGGCLNSEISCAEGEQLVSDECGCGCKAITNERQCARDSLGYRAFRGECDEPTFECGDAEFFSDDCGCGCKVSPSCDPTVSYFGYGDVCELFEFSCDGNFEAVRDLCGCGCRPVADPNDAN